MKFRTEYESKPGNLILDPQRSLVLIGSCFTDYIGERMRMCRWSAYPNVTGTLYNPKSISKILRLATTWENVSDAIDCSLAQRDQLWMSWLSDSGSTTYSKKETKERVFRRLLDLRNKLKGARALIVTFGTAWIFELKERPGYVVSNCHKFPAEMFLRRRLSVSEIVSEWKELLDLLSQSYPELRIIFTVSPVRHLKDGFEGNSRSKAILQLACEEICKECNSVDYFPSYEIMNDDLRDYRFYGPDLVHPSEKAVDYIWEKFQERYLSKDSRILLVEGEKVTKRLNHRPLLFGNSEMAQSAVSLQKKEAAEYYNKFMAAHPSMLYIDE
ncbi:MAG: GSCFA domain-containing protein [Muribaculaceae bacterium]|nr:GSCFA domain-containing protein [Muribaculaceae bacterium]